MIIKQLEVQAFRNIAQATLFPHPRLTLLSGSNGSGKSSVLEAIHCLSTGHSYRTRRYKELIKHDSEAYLVSAVLNNKQTEQEHRCGLQRYRDGRVDLKLDFETITAISPITQLLAIKTLTPDCHRLLQEGPDERRAFLDWGVFHVKQDYFMVWKNFKRVLNQRNQLLKLQSPRKEVEVWDEEYVYAANLIDFNRTEYLSKLAKALNNRLQEYDIGFHVELVYKPGWDSSVELKTLLRKNYSYHTRMKTTTDGPHRGDLVVNIDSISAKKVLSRGQEKYK